MIAVYLRPFRQCRFDFRRSMSAALLLPLVLAGCSLPSQPSASASRDHAFISYSPASANGRLRLAVKDIIDMRGMVTTAGSQHLLKNNPPARRDAALMRRVRQSGVRIVGKTNLTEFALGTSGLNEFYGTPVNPLDRRRIPGGSSSGSAVAVASGAADVAIGSDTAGSIRVPAACCGILGLKTTFGLVPLDGVFPLSPRNLDTIGPMARNVPHLVQGMELLDPRFAGHYRAAQAAHPSGADITVGRLYLQGTEERIDRALDAALEKAGFRIVRLSARFRKLWEEAQDHGATVAIADGWFSDRQYLGKLGVAATTKAAIQLGQVQATTAYEPALEARSEWQRALRDVFKEVDLIALPTLQTLPPRKPLFGRSAVSEARVLAMQNTVAVNYAGNPAIAVPVPIQDRAFPFTSLQLVGPRLAEGELVNAARFIMREVL